MPSKGGMGSMSSKGDASTSKQQQRYEGRIGSPLVTMAEPYHPSHKQKSKQIGSNYFQGWYSGTGTSNPTTTFTQLSEEVNRYNSNENNDSSIRDGAARV